MTDDANSTGAQAPAGTPPQPAPPATGGPPEARAYADRLGIPYSLRSNNRTRRTIARRMGEAKRTVPHAYLSIRCAVDALQAERRARAGGGKGPTVTDCLVRACALALRAEPRVNVGFGERETVQFERADVSVAVATAQGLVVPVVRDAAAKSLECLSAELRDLVSRARAGRLAPADLEGGTFTLSNLGNLGVRAVTPVINPPQSAILGVGGIDTRLELRDGRPVEVEVVECVLSFDHRTIDGDVAARWLQAFRHAVENPQTL
ncbi:MAG: 2-oxo acid dehydrogenase subunit E2 [Steroidobacteraceae bacterium]|nr:2-oxo acid dehydrogenase subunit E2 [Steroidobacteraceae bacterium]